MRRVLRGLVVLGVVLLLAGCGSSSHDGGQASGSSDHNAQDVTFAQQMIPHHQQAVAMADLASTRASNAQVKDLAARIKAAQDPEIVKMQGWLSSWGMTSTSSGHGMSGMLSMPSGTGMGMMSDSEMSMLGATSGTAFDRQFLTMMTAHHDGAIEMAKTELDKGQNQAAKDLATSIRDGQQREVDEMASILKALPAA